MDADICQITDDEEADYNLRDDIGSYDVEYGPIVWSATKYVIIRGNAGLFLASINLFKKSERYPYHLEPKPVLLLKIGGLPKTKEQILSQELDVSLSCAKDILYLRTRSHYSKELESKLIELNKNNKQYNIFNFGLTKQMKASAYWDACMRHIEKPYSEI